MPLFDLSKLTEQDRFKQWAIKVVEAKSLVEGKAKREGTLSQNNYFHLIVSHFALQYGETMEYVKVEFVKKRICKEIFITERANRKTGELRPALRSWADLDKEERTIVINKFIDYAAKEANIRLPQPEDLAYLKEVRVEVERNKQYL